MLVVVVEVGGVGVLVVVELIVVALYCIGRLGLIELES